MIKLKDLISELQITNNSSPFVDVKIENNTIHFKLKNDDFIGWMSGNIKDKFIDVVLDGEEIEEAEEIKNEFIKVLQKYNIKYIINQNIITFNKKHIIK